NKVTFVGTDGRRLSKITREFPDILPFEKGIILPGKAVKEIQKLLDSGEIGKIAFEPRDRRVYFRIGDVDLICKLIDGQYPDYEQVIPKKVEQTLKLNRNQFEQSIRQVAVMAAEPSRQVKFIFNDGLILNATTPDLGDSQAYVQCEYSNEEITIAFNSGYLTDIIKSLNSDQIVLGFSSSSSPAVIKDPDDGDFISVIMPMKI
ncbi:MAG: DNA polymerase III subunit beta, partial [Spirochaetia bacterium]|nr:DNA polymerase III subunit beta [Spirochaetia bacterium]